MKIRSYGKLVDILGAEREIGIDAPCTIAELRARVGAECPDAVEPLAHRRVFACVNDSIVADNYLVHAGDVVELLAPVSGG